MFASLHIPRPALGALLIERPDYRHQPVVVLDEAEKITTSKRDRGKLRVLEMSAEAEEFGVHSGMTAVQAQARCDYLILLNRSLPAEAELTEMLLGCAGDFTPDFEDTDFGTCVLDLGGVAAIERDAIQIARQIQQRILDNNHQPQIGIAPNPDLAILASRACEHFPDSEDILVLHQTDIERVLAPLPITLLNLQPSMSDLFCLWGLRNLGGLSRLSRSDLVERQGNEAGRFWDQAGGKSHRLLHLVKPLAEYSSSTDLDYEVTSVEAIAFLIRRLLETIAARLQSSYLVAAQLSLQLDFTDGNLYHRVFRIPEPCADVDQLTGMLEVHLENFEARAPVRGITLRAIPTRPGKHQFDLFAAGVKDPNRLSETLGRVEALLGSERFGVPRLRSTHHPDSFDMRPFRPGKELVTPDDETPLIMSRLPMRRYRPRRHIRVICDDRTGYSGGPYPIQSPSVQGTVSRRGATDCPTSIISGDFRGRIIDHRGPFSTSGDWWEKRNYWRREEWDIEHENGKFYRLAQEKGEWFVEAAG